MKCHNLKPSIPCLWKELFFLFSTSILFSPLALQWWQGHGPHLHGLSSDEEQGITWIKQEIVYRAVMGIQCCCALGHSWVRECWICSGGVDFRFHMLRDFFLWIVTALCFACREVCADAPATHVDAHWAMWQQKCWNQCSSIYSEDQPTFFWNLISSASRKTCFLCPSAMWWYWCNCVCDAALNPFAKWDTLSSQGAVRFLQSVGQEASGNFSLGWSSEVQEVGGGPER